MPVAIQIPNVRGSNPPAKEELTEMLEQAEAAGFHSAWVMENQLGTASALEPLSVLAFAAAQTTRIRLGVAVSILALHQPVRLAREAVTIDHLSEGRLILGAGIGAPGLPYEAFGTSQNERARRFEEYLTVMRRLWEEPNVDLDGRFVQLTQAKMEPKPLQNPLPVWFGASSPRALKRTAKFADGWIGGGASPSSAFPEMLAQLRQCLDAEGRDPSSFPVGKRAYIAIDRPQEEVDQWFRAVYGGAIPSEVATTGSAEEVAHELRQLKDAGADLLLIAPVGDDRPQLELIIEHLLPALG